jgi:hypothetical protein
VEKAYQAFLQKVQSGLLQFFQRNPIFSQKAVEDILSQATPEQILDRFFAWYPIRESRMYLFIDEYDHFTHEILTQDLDAFQRIVSVNGYMRKFYEVIKNATQMGVVDKIFITGVSPITLEGLTSGFNILTHLSCEEDFASMMGFSEAEVRSLLRLVLEDPSQEEAIMQDLRYYYNGYILFSLAGIPLQPRYGLIFSKALGYGARIPRRNARYQYRPDYEKLKNMFEIANFRQNREVLEEVIEKETVSCKPILQFSFSLGFGRTEFINFLYYVGNLTIKRVSVSGLIELKVPNKVIEELYWRYYAHLLQREADLPSEASEFELIVDEMARTGKTDNFFSNIQKLLQELSNRDYQGFSEKYIKMAIMAYVMQSGIFYIQSERGVKGGGYLDLELYIRPASADKHHQFALEIKYLKKEEEAQKDWVMQEAKAQLLKYYQNDEILQSKAQLHLPAAVVVKDSVYVEEAPLTIV